ncbi:acyltransferase family protein [Saccharibacillus deserti]|uniref:acyltransferase family protein n=1 Tax=Saccharibacillus deserti TaxID=1634444 RepID=UPI001556748E|nr:acyltransferase family protein [Saccharibacillus deserti]
MIVRKTEYIQEVGLVRVVACLSIILLHSIQFTIGFEWTEGSPLLDYALLTAAGILAFGTPAFVFISELLLSRSYPDRFPKAFYKKRILMILTPFVCMAVFYAIFANYDDPGRLPYVVVLNLMGDYHGWFVLVVFQFYVLHRLFTKFLSRIPAKVVLAAAFVINAAYLAFFNFVKQPSGGRLISFVWERGYWVPFLGWIFYFCLAYYCGRRYDDFLAALDRYKRWIVIGTLVAAAPVLFVNSLNVLGFGSKRVDMLPLSLMLILLLFLIAFKVKIRSRWLDLIDSCSFGIYLIHYFYLMLYSGLLDRTADLGYFEIPLLFAAALISSIVTVLAVNKLPFGKYILGRAGGRTGRNGSPGLAAPQKAQG